MNTRDFSRRPVVAVAAFLASLMLPSAGYAQLPDPHAPLMTFDSGGKTHYDSAAQLLSIDASALGVLLPGEPPADIRAATGTAGSPGCNPSSNCGTFTIRAVVNNSGVLVGGVDGPDLTIVGKVVDLFGGTVADGILLTGDVKEFFVLAGAANPFQLRFAITGGLLKDFFNQCGTSGQSLCDLAVKIGISLPDGRVLFTGSFASSFDGGAHGDAGAIELLVAPLPPPPPVVTGVNAVAEATGPNGAAVTFVAGATDSNGANLPVNCIPASGSVFALGQTTVTCTSGPDLFGQTGRNTLLVRVQDTTPPMIIGSNVEVEADGPHGQSSVLLPVTASDLVDGVVVVTCDPPSGSAFPIGSTPVMCTATDAVGNLATRINVGAPELAAYILVTVKENPPALPGGACFVVNFREITYFRGQSVITSWPYRASGGVGYTKSRGTQFRVYGFQPAELGQLIRNVDNTWTTYPVQYDSEVRGYYIDLGGPARVMICPAQLHEYVLAGKKGNGHMEGSTLLPLSQQNVPGIMLTHNTQIVKVPSRVRKELYQLGLYQAARGVIDYVGFQLQGNGNAEFREFVDVEVQFAGDSATDRLQHYQFGFHTAINTNFETFAGCSYVDYAPGNDAVRLHDVWGPNRSKLQGYASWQACGSKEPSVNQKQRANYEVPFNSVQILPTVNTGTDTLRLFFGPIRAIPESEMKKKDHKTDWADWDRWDY